LLFGGNNMGCLENKGMTLVELLLAIAISAGLMTVVGGMYVAMLTASQKGYAEREVVTQGNAVMATLVNLVRNADSITAPALGASGTTLTVTTTPAGESPASVTLVDGRLWLTRGANAPVSLTDMPIVINVSEFTVSNVSGASTPGAVRINFSLLGTSSSTLGVTRARETFTTTISRKQP